MMFIKSKGKKNPSYNIWLVYLQYYFCSITDISTTSQNEDIKVVNIAVLNG